MLKDLSDIIVITGHYGSGKTNLALNLALTMRKDGKSVALCDLDVVNPYFRTADFKNIAKEHDISIFASDYANTNLDIPSLSGGLESAINGGRTVIIDVGGDDAGATALGRYAPRIKQLPYTMIYVINAYRYLTRKPNEACELLKEIESASRLKATHIANCSNLAMETTAEDLKKSLPYAKEVSRLTGLPIIFTAASHKLQNTLSDIRDIYPVDIFVKTPWN